MPTANIKQCPACWSTIDAESVQCPQCEARLQQPKRGATFTVVLIVILAAGALAWGWLQRESDGPATGRGEEDTTGIAKREPERTVHVAKPVAPKAPAPESKRGRRSRIAVYGSRTNRGVVLAALGEPNSRTGTVHYCVPASLLPTDEDLVDADGEPLAFTVITWERGTGLVLLAGRPPEPAEGFAPRPARDPRTLGGEEVLFAVSTKGKRREVRRVRGGVPMTFDSPLAAGSIVLDGEGRLVAYGTATGGLPVHALAPWREWWNGRPLAAMQKEIRASDPQLILADARQLLDSKSVTIEKADRALELLTRGQHMARDRATMEAFGRTLRFAHRQKIRLLSEDDGVRALQQARASLAALGTDPDILGDATELAMSYGDARDALAFYQTLLATSADHAAKLRDRVSRQLKARADRLLREKRNQEASQLLAEGVRSFPQRADLRMLYARALSRLGDRSSAQYQAAEAARLDRSYAGLASRYREPSGRGRDTVVIPFEKGAGSIPTTASVAGQTLGFVVDTGASYTTIPTATAKALGLLDGNSPIVDVTTAGGTVKARQVVLPSITVGGKLTVRKVKALVLDLTGNLQGKGLLGLNVLSQLNMRIDSQRSRLILSRRRSGK